ncbi:hypothetical protein [Streptomyces sp. NPDC093589]|uniref:hypothetical protein n=1 Tax=Streptomyces sp. NPDC093589 TaxID=3366043 RepID=UPI0038218169
MQLPLVDMVNGYKVSTVELPFMIPVSAPDGGASYETMVFQLSADGAVIDEVDVRRYATPEAACAGHADMVRDVTVIESAFAS